MIARPSRRTVIIGAGAAAAVATGGGLWILTGRLEPFVADILHHHLRDEPLVEGAVARYAADYVAAATPDILTKGDLLAKAARGVGVAGIDAFFAGRPEYDRFKSVVVTRFLLGSTAFSRAAPDEPIDYVGLLPACPNPFAQFSQSRGGAFAPDP